MAEIRENCILRSNRWKEPLRVVKIEKKGDYIELYAEGLNSKRFYREILLNEELKRIMVIPEEAIVRFSGDPEKFFFSIEAQRIRLAYDFDPFHAVSVSKIDPLPHQIEGVYQVILKKPKIRFLLADDPGAGKTIMAGLIFKELKFRGLVEKCLIVVPGHLKYQWQREMKEKFKEHFEIIDRNVMNAAWGKNIWEERNQCITSMDFAKQNDVLDTLKEVRWDLVIVDEAHKMAAYKYGAEVKKTQRYKLGEVLSKTTTYFLFLTATPHKGDPYNFLLLLDLLEPQMFTPETLREATRKRENPLLLRRMKEDLKDFNNRPLFPPRYIHTIRYTLSPHEKKLYEAVTRYVFNYYQKAVERENRNVQLALLILQRRLASSVRAIRRSLERRKKRLEEMYRQARLFREEERFPELEELEDLPEEERWKYEEKLLRLTLAENLDELKEEIDQLSELIKIAKEVERIEVETKLVELKKVMEKLMLHKKPKVKLLVFTEAKDTLDYLVEKIKSWGYSVTFIHGGMNQDQRIDAEREFWHEKQVMVATEAAGEGINLQCCWLMINYDIPWNPNRLEQRMGRIHRYKQTHEVHVYNLVAVDTREGKVLEKILFKLEIMRKQIGDKVFDVIGEIYEGISLDRLIKQALAGEKTWEEIYKEVDVPDERLIRKAKQALAESLAVKFIDIARLQNEMEKARENRLIPEYIENFFVKAFQMFGGKIEKRKDGFYRVYVPAQLRRISVSFKNRFGKVDKYYPKISFDKEKLFEDPEAEFVAPGHPLLEVVVEKFIQEFKDVLRSGAVFYDPDGKLNGVIWFIIGEIRDGMHSVVGRRLFAIYMDKEGKAKQVNPSILWDLKPAKVKVPDEIVQLASKKDEIVNFAIGLLSDYRDKLKRERERELRIKREYSTKSIDYLLEEEKVKLLKLQVKQEKEGKDKYRLAILREEERIRELERRKKEILKEIELEKSLALIPPEVVGIAAVLPLREIEDYLKSDAEIERIGMEVSMKYERAHGRDPEDVSQQNLGFDIRSKSKDGKEVRYIEVKARAGEGKIVLTPNEWINAQRFGDRYWLYVVTNAATNPRLYLIQNPANNLKPKEVVEVVRYLVDEDEWKKAATKAM